MKDRKRLMIIGGVIFSLAVVLGIGITSAFGPKNGWGGFHRGFHGIGFHHGPPIEEITEFIMWKMDRRARELNLTEPQRREFERIKDEVRSTIAEAIERRREFHRRVMEELDRETPDIVGLADTIKGRVNSIPQMVSTKIDLLVNFYDMLDNEQKARLVEMCRSRTSVRQDE
jgi:Spy/CpxP family protein refolding chaperone